MTLKSYRSSGGYMPWSRFIDGSQKSVFDLFDEFDAEDYDDQKCSKPPKKYPQAIVVRQAGVWGSKWGCPNCRKEYGDLRSSSYTVMSGDRKVRLIGCVACDTEAKYPES